jgi:hypothetical protein
MTPLEQFQRTIGPTLDTGAAEDLQRPDRLAPILGSVGGLLMLVNARDPLLRVAAGVLTAGSLYYGIVTRPKAEEA